jgi:hypothetical protein
MPIQLTGSLDISGSILLNGTAVTASGGGGGSTSLTDNLEKYVNFDRADYTYIATTNGQTINVYLSESNATYFISSSATLTTTANVNLYFYPEVLAPNEVTAVHFETPPKSTVTTVFVVRTLPTITGSGAYWYPSASPGGMSNNIQSTSANTISRKTSTFAQNSPLMYKNGDGIVYFNTFGSYPVNGSNAYVYYTSSQGTPL